METEGRDRGGGNKKNKRLNMTVTEQYMEWMTMTIKLLNAECYKVKCMTKLMTIITSHSLLSMI